MIREYVVPRRVLLFRWLMRPAFRILFYILSPIKITGAENVPKQGAYIIAINHVSLYEAPFLVAFWPVAPEAVGAADIWERRGQSALVKGYGGIPIHRGEYDRRIMEVLLAVLRSGRPLLISPEGGRSHVPGMRQAYPGVVFLIEQSGVPVVPVGIVGTTEDYLERAIRGKRPLLEMRIGTPMHLPDRSVADHSRRESRQSAADLIMAHIAALLPADYRGIYANHPFLSETT